MNGYIDRRAIEEHDVIDSDKHRVTVGKKANKGLQRVAITLAHESEHVRINVECLAFRNAQAKVWNQMSQTDKDKLGGDFNEWLHGRPGDKDEIPVLLEGGGEHGLTPSLMTDPAKSDTCDVSSIWGPIYNDDGDHEVRARLAERDEVIVNSYYAEIYDWSVDGFQFIRANNK